MPAAATPNTACVATVIQSRVAWNQGNTAVKPYMFTPYKHRPNAAPASMDGKVRRRLISAESARPYATESAKWTIVATSITVQSKLAGGGNTLRPMTMAAAKRASLKRIAGRASAKTDHKAICTTVATMPAIMPAYAAALQFTGTRIGRVPVFTAETRTAET